MSGRLVRLSVEIPCPETLLLPPPPSSAAHAWITTGLRLGAPKGGSPVEPLDSKLFFLPSLSVAVMMKKDVTRGNPVLQWCGFKRREPFRRGGMHLYNTIDPGFGTTRELKLGFRINPLCIYYYLYTILPVLFFLFLRFLSD